MNKRSTIELIILRLQQNISEIDHSLEDYRSGSSMEEGDTMDPDDYSKQGEQKEMQYNMQVQLDNAKADLTLLKDFTDKEYAIAKAGALVETEKNLFFMGISFSTIKVGDKELLGVSPESPAFNQMLGKVAGDQFTLGKTNFNILNVS